ncbi:MIP04111p [Gryllus bimaculatus]|nr:MIP04111p [Gryllus bimaculatus]
MLIYKKKLPYCEIALKMAVKNLAHILKQTFNVTRCNLKNTQHTTLRCKSVAADTVQSQCTPIAVTAIPASHQTVRVIFNNHKTADFKTIWLRDNCKCSVCVHEETRQKMLDSPSLDVAIKPKSLTVTNNGNLVITWHENGQDHVSTFDSSWLYRYGQSFIHENFESEGNDDHPKRLPVVLWDRTEIWKSLPEISYNEGQLVELVKHFAYVKETQYGVTFDVMHEPDPQAHPAFSGLYLHHHTDMNYREKSPGMQLLHCLKATDPKSLGYDPGGMSFFVDGFRIAKWLEDNEPSAFHILTSTPARFQIKTKGKRYSQLWPIITLNQDGDVCEIHYNNRTMGPLQAPSHIIVPFYHAYKLFSEKMRHPSSELKFHMVPGDLVAFNNRRVLHGRTAFDPTKVSRHLVGCYVDIDETFSLYDSLLSKSHQ